MHIFVFFIYYRSSQSRTASSVLCACCPL